MNRSRARRRMVAWERYYQRYADGRINRGYRRAMIPFAKGYARQYLLQSLRHSVRL